MTRPLSPEDPVRVLPKYLILVDREVSRRGLIPPHHSFSGPGTGPE